MSFAAALLAADRAVLSHLGASAVTYTSGDGSGSAVVSGIFDAAHVMVDVGQAGVSSVGPAVFLVLADLPSDPDADSDAAIQVSGTSYTVWKAVADGQGGTLLHLHKV